jgi:hypothetical protein
MNEEQRIFESTFGAIMHNCVHNAVERYEMSSTGHRVDTFFYVREEGNPFMDDRGRYWDQELDDWVPAVMIVHLIDVTF